MTEDQIKAIAEEFAKSHDGVGQYDYLGNEYEAYIDGFDDAINWILTRYCIVEREKVMEKYNEVETINDACDDLLADDRAMFHYLFGTSMFNQNEE